MSEDNQETVVCTSLEEALAHVESLEAAAGEAVQKYHQAVQQLTGHQPGKPVEPMDVVKIVRKIQAGDAVNG